MASLPSATNYASAVNVTESWVRLQLLIKRSPSITMPPDVLLHVALSPAQSLSLYPAGEQLASCHRYSKTHLGEPFK